MHDIEENHHKGLHQSAAAAGLSKECTAMEAIIEFILVEVEAASFFPINIPLSSSPLSDAECIHLGMSLLCHGHSTTQTVHHLWILMDVHMCTHKPIGIKCITMDSA